MTKRPNILFIMCDQLRQDYLSCYGHSTLDTPNIDSLAKRGVQFTNAYCQAPECAPSRASFYSGRYLSSHGVMGYEDATRLDEQMISDYLEPLGYRTAVVGKSHSFKKESELRRLGVDMNTAYAKASQHGGFEPYEAHEGHVVCSVAPNDHGYSNYLRSLGYDAANPWQSCANSSIAPNGEIHDGWKLRSARFPAAVSEEHSETAFITSRAIDFIAETEDRPWCLHLSYIKPHWPVIAPKPYHNLFGPSDVQPVVSNQIEIKHPHPVYQAFTQLEYSRTFCRNDVRETVIPVYMGLVKQIDDHLGRLFEVLEKRALVENTIIIFTSDHGDYLGDHGLGEKYLFHDASVKIPLIIAAPGVENDATRGMKRDELVEAVDILPTLIQLTSADTCHERLEGHSLLPLLELKATAANWREFAVSELDYSDQGVRNRLGLDADMCRAIMIKSHRWKYIHYWNLRPQLFDLHEDPNEFVDLGSMSEYKSICHMMDERLVSWQNSLKRRVGLAYDCVLEQGPDRDEKNGFIIGRW